MTMTVRLLGLGLGGLLLFVGLASADAKKEDVPRLVKDLKNKVAKVRAAAAEDLGELGAINASHVKDAIPALMDLLKKDKEATVRRAAARALGRVDADPKEAVPLLVEALKDKSPDVQMAAMASLGQIGAPAKPALPTLREIQKDKEKKRLSQEAAMAIKRIMAR
jgi:HEAT repeat protein